MVKSKKKIPELDVEKAFQELTKQFIDKHMVSYLMHCLLNMPSGEMSLQDFNNKVKILLTTLLKDQIILPKFNPTVHNIPLSILKLILKRTRTKMQKILPIKLELTVEKWLEDDNNDAFDEETQTKMTNFVVLKVVNSEQLAVDNIIKSTENDQISFKNFKPFSLESKYLNVVLTFIINSESGKASVKDLTSNEITSENKIKMSKRAMENLLNDFTKFDYLRFLDEDNLTICKKFRIENKSFIERVFDGDKLDQEDVDVQLRNLLLS